MNFQYKIYHNPKTKNWKIDFSFVSEYCATFMSRWPLLRGRGWGLHILSWDMQFIFYQKLNFYHFGTLCNWKLSILYFRPRIKTISILECSKAQNTTQRAAFLNSCFSFLVQVKTFFYLGKTGISAKYPIFRQLTRFKIENLYAFVDTSMRTLNLSLFFFCSSKIRVVSFI